MDEALRVVVEMNDCVRRRFMQDLEDVTREEADWRPVREANSINLILRHLRIDALWHVQAIEETDSGPGTSLRQAPESMPLDFERSLREVEEACTRFVAVLRGLTLTALRQRTLLAYQGTPQGPPSDHFLGFHLALHLAAHDGQIRTLRNLYRRTRGQPARFFPENPTFPA